MQEAPSFETETKPGSNRTFGLIFAALFLTIGLHPLVKGGQVRLWEIVVGGLFLLAALIRPVMLAPLNRLWFHFGLFLHKLVSPLVMMLLFLLAIVPMGMVLRLTGKDPLRRSPNGKAESYWIPRDPPGPAQNSLRNQF